MTVKELLQKEPYPGTPVGIYEMGADGKTPQPLFLGDRLGGIECCYSGREIESHFEAYYEPAKATGTIIYVKRKGA